MTVTVNIPLNENIVINGQYNFSMQHLDSDYNAYPTIYLVSTIDKPAKLYGVDGGDHITFDTKDENRTIKCVRLFFEESKSKDKDGNVIEKNYKLSFNLMLQEGSIRKGYVPYGKTEDDISYLAEYCSDVVNPRMFGAKGDGTTDDTLELQAAFDYAIKAKKKMVLDSGSTYLISRTLKLNGQHLYFDGQGATIKMDTNIIMDKEPEDIFKIENMITINIAGEATDVSKENGISKHNNGTYYHRVFKNVILDCTEGTAKTALNIETGGRTHYSNIQICDPASYGFVIAGGNEAVIDNIYATRSRVKDRKEKDGVITNLDRESVGIKINASDHYIHDCVTIDFKTGFQSSGGDNHFARCHAWNAYTPSIISKSISFEVKSGYATFSQCIADSTRYGWVLRGTARVYLSNCCNAYNSLYADNKDIYGEPVLFYFDKSESTPHHLKGDSLYISASNFKTRDGLNCHFDNLTEYENPIIIDKLNCQTFKDVHISEAVRTNDLRGIGLINNK